MIVHEVDNASSVYWEQLYYMVLNFFCYSKYTWLTLLNFIVTGVITYFSSMESKQMPNMYPRTISEQASMIMMRVFIQDFLSWFKQLKTEDDLMAQEVFYHAVLVLPYQKTLNTAIFHYVK